MCMCTYLVTSVPCPVAWVRAGLVGTSGPEREHRPATVW